MVLFELYVSCYGQLKKHIMPTHIYGTQVQWRIHYTGSCFLWLTNSTAISTEDFSSYAMGCNKT